MTFAVSGLRRSSINVAHARELQLKVDAVALSLGLELRNLAAKLLGRLGVLSCFGHLALELGDACVALGDGLLLVGTCAAYLLLTRLRLLLTFLPICLGFLLRLRLLLAAIGLTAHVCLPLRSGGQHEDARTFTGIFAERHKLLILG